MKLDRALIDSLHSLAGIYRGFEGSLTASLPERDQKAVDAFLAKKIVNSGWSTESCKKFVMSKVVDQQLAQHARSCSLSAEVNDELATQDPSFDFSIEGVKIETKHMPYGGKQLAFRRGYTENETCIRWRQFDVFLAWRESDLRGTKFRPWAMMLSCLLSPDIWDIIWQPNIRERNYRGGKHLDLMALPNDLAECVVLL